MNRALLQLFAEFKASARLRLGVYALLVMAWGLGLSEWHDRNLAQEASMAEMQQELARLAVFENDKTWAGRAEEASQLLQSLTRGFYTGSRSQAQAQMRDALTTLSSKHSLKVIDLTVQATGLNGPVGQSNAEAAGQVTEAENANAKAAEPETLRARLVVDFTPEAVSAFLLSISQHDTTFVVDRLTVRNRAQAPNQPAQAEIELRAFLLPNEASP